ncbi:phosphoethanolamine transferase [Chryseobacterium hagamense]|uniref:Phosphate starvation-inducible protein PsiE n=1 Tax=Chryseobacterium hagamense TaxID=395935 RepID=A0A511YIA7_9FLAO|nr:phosphoethanolamine transferase [Chryseobacterium hagamense]GEN74934.1 phosphate starvation-inducible protein PsiE [Chryseobacterium hagamense]
MLKKIILTLLIIVYLTGFLLSFPYIFDHLFGAEKLDSIRNFFEYGTMFCSFLVFNALLFKNKYTSVIAIILCLVLSLNFLISASCYLIYHSGFNVGMAISILESNPDEVMSMSYMFILPGILFLVFLGMLLYSVSYLKKDVVKFNAKFIIIALLWLILPFVYHFKHTYISNKGGGKMIKNVYYHLSDFNMALNIQREINEIKRNVPVFDIKKIQPGIKNVILIIGESERNQNMSLYGYHKKTTPHMDEQAGNMMIFDHAVSPAGITNLSVPLILSSIHPDEFRYHYNRLSYNIINLANQSGYHSFWFSTQASARGITAIASMAKNKKWINGFDEVLVPELKKVIQKKEDKFIVLHITGSHPNPCNRTPPNWNSEGMDCYDSSIRYTDSVFKNIVSILKSTNSVVIYTSDHGLKIQGDRLLHVDSKESTQVPFFVWYGDKVSANYRITGHEPKQTQTTYIYPLIMKYMGLEAPRHYKNEGNKYLNLEMKSIEYGKLPE